MIAEMVFYGFIVGSYFTGLAVGFWIAKTLDGGRQEKENDRS